MNARTQGEAENGLIYRHKPMINDQSKEYTPL